MQQVKAAAQRHYARNPKRLSFRNVELVLQPKHNRKCLICDALCWPNFYYCKFHHGYISTTINTTDTFPDSPKGDEYEGR